MSFEYAIVTPARDEAGNLPRLAASLALQTRLPERWVIVENGSTDATLEVARGLQAEHPWIEAHSATGSEAPQRGGAVVRAINKALDVLVPAPEILINVDADISMAPDYFERLLEAFAADARLGIASGSAWELHRGEWKQRFVTRGTVWGASRAYRRECLQAVLPFEERIGWDGLDELRANSLGWRTAAFTDLQFFHHRAEGERDGARVRRWLAQGDLAHYMGYRPSYLFARVGFRLVKDPAALAMLYGWASAAARREARWTDVRARAYLREQQRWRRLPLAARQALGRTPAR